MKRKRGRPSLDPAARLSAPVHLRLLLQHYDALCQRAAQARCTVPALIRATLEDISGTKNRT